MKINELMFTGQLLPSLKDSQEHLVASLITEYLKMGF